MQDIVQSEWKSIVDDSRYTIKAISDDVGIDYSLFKKYLDCQVSPREKNKTRVLSAMNKLTQEKKIPFHPSYGYATPEQIKKLEEMGFCPERDMLLKQIQKQNATRGKVK